MKDTVGTNEVPFFIAVMSKTDFQKLSAKRIREIQKASIVRIYSKREHRIKVKRK